MINTEQIAYWFFRLNGCLIIDNFNVHPENYSDGKSQLTDTDIIAVRFPYRREFALRSEPMEDHFAFNSDGKTDLILAEVKKSGCNINDSVTDPNRLIINRLIYAIGVLPEKLVPEAAKSIYKSFEYSDQKLKIRIFAIGRNINPELHENVVQIQLDDILRFIHSRINLYQRQKRNHPQWRKEAQLIYKLATTFDEEAFVTIILSIL